jgi:hypothetical protein
VSLDVYLELVQPVAVFDANITHNLGAMAREAGVYLACWRPEEIGAEKAADIVPVLTEGLRLLREDPDRFKALNPENGWGDYEGLVNFVQSYRDACMESPEAAIRVCR